MMKLLRVFNVAVIVALVMSAAFVYKVKFESTIQAEKLAKLRLELRREREAIATLRAQWSTLDSPLRIQALVQRHLNLKPIESSQYEVLDRLPARPPGTEPKEDPIGAIIEDLEELDLVTGSLAQPAGSSDGNRASN